jgi:integrase
VPYYPVLTEIMLKAAKPPERGTITIWDGAVKHFGVRVSQGGTKSFMILMGSGRRQTIGRFPTLSLAIARTRAKELLAEYTLGKTRPRSAAFDDVVAAFLEACEEKNRPRTVRDYKRLLNRHIAFGRKNISEVTRHDISRKLDKLKETSSEQNHAMAAAKVFFTWAHRHGYIDHSPCEGLAPVKRLSRDRVLSDEELRAVLTTALDGATPFSQIVALLILTGQRRGEIAALRWEWIDPSNRAITIPATVTKNKRTHTFPYGRMVEELLERIPHQGDYLFPAARERIKGKPATVFNGWAKPKETFDAVCEVRSWQLHDLRRTFATNLAALGVAPHVTERLLNHVSGTISGVAAIYNRFQYVEEMRDAIERWETRLSDLLCE